MQRRTLHIACFAVLLAALWLPMLQEWTGVFPEHALAGVEEIQDSVPLTQTSWLNGKFQANYAQRHYKWMGLRATMVRLRNQLDYSIFREPYHSVLIGNDHELFGRKSLEAMQGQDFVGWEMIRYHARNTAALQQQLAARNVRMLVVLTPSKLQCMPSFLPGEDVVIAPNSNYPAYLSEFRNLGVQFLDLTTPLTTWIATEQHRVFPRTGTHWTDYGAFLGANVILTEMERLGGHPLVHPTLVSMQPSMDMRDTDADAGDLLNLLVDIPPAEVHYPTLRFDTTGKFRPRTLVVGDSFWWKIYNQGIHKQAFAPGSQYRYYNYEVFSDQWQDARYIQNFDLRQSVEGVDWVILCVNMDNLHRYPFDFVDQALSLYMQ